MQKLLLHRAVSAVFYPMNNSIQKQIFCFTVSLSTIKLCASSAVNTLYNDLIHIGNPIPFNEEEFLQELETLTDAAYSNKRDIRRQVERMVSTYHPADNKKAVVKDKTYNKLLAMPARQERVQVASFQTHVNNQRFS